MAPTGKDLNQIVAELNRGREPAEPMEAMEPMEPMEPIEAIEAMASDRRQRRHQPSLGELIQAGKESYYIVSQFNLFEYEQEAPLFARLSDRFERCILGLTLVREELGPRKPLMLPPAVN